MKVSELELQPDAEVTDEMLTNILTKVLDQIAPTEDKYADIASIIAGEDWKSADQNKRDMTTMEYALSHYPGMLPDNDDPDAWDALVSGSDWNDYFNMLHDKFYPDELTETEIQVDTDNDGDTDIAALDADGDNNVDATSISDDDDDSTGKKKTEDTVTNDSDISADENNKNRQRTIADALDGLI